ncbi:murein biosynthesis integral membrane protein MurJ [bacterium]|nr:MAG: murein biosynthesis integral membrane protein MurJ [bacterium]
MIKKLLNGQSKTITSAAILLGIAALASKSLGFIKLRLLSTVFTTPITDTFFVAVKAPDFIFNLLVLGAISASFIPIFVSYLDKKDIKDGWDFVNGILNFLLISTAIISIVFIIFAPFIVRILAPGLVSDPERFNLTVSLMRVLFLSPIIFAASSVMGGILRSFKRFLLYAIAPIFYNVGIIFGIVFLSKPYGIYGVAIGSILGASMHFLIQFIGALALGFRFKFILPFKHKGVTKLARLMVPHVMGIATNQVNILVFTFLASRLLKGDITIFNYANIIQNLPIGLFSISLALAAFPTLAILAAKKQREEFAKTFSDTARQILFWIIPTSAILFALRAQLVRAIVGSRNFSWEATVATYQTLGYFAIGMFAVGLLPLLSRAFYALNDTMTPFLAGLVSVAVSVVGGFYLSNKMGVSGLGIAFVIAATINMLILLILLKIRLKDIKMARIFKMLAKILPATAIMLIVIQTVKYWVAPQIDMQTFYGIAYQSSLAGMAGIAVYCSVCLALKCEEMITFLQALGRRIHLKKPVQVTEIIEDIDEQNY